MSTTVLTDEQIEDAAWDNRMENSRAEISATAFKYARAIEQSVLQSPEVQAWKKDAEAFRAMVSKRLTVCVRELGHEVEVFYDGECLAWPACDPKADDGVRAEVTRSAIAEAVAAMEKQP